MTPRVLFVSNGHGEASIAGRIAEDVRAADAGAVLDHFPLVGTGLGGATMNEVGPRRSMPSGGLVAMGNVRAFARDLQAGFVGLFFAQLRFLREARGRYDAVVAVGDAYALGLALTARAPVVFVGTAKSAYVAPYGPFERTLLRRAVDVFVRDERTVGELQRSGVDAAAPGNVIVDLLRADAPALAGKWIGLLPGSRERAYEDGVRLARVLRALGERGEVRGILSVAPTLKAETFARALRDDGWDVRDGDDPQRLHLTCGGATIVGWTRDARCAAALVRARHRAGRHGERSCRRVRHTGRRARQRRGPRGQLVPHAPAPAARRRARTRRRRSRPGRSCRRGAAERSA